MNELIYSFRDNNVRVVEIDNVVWFVAKDVCEVLEIKNTTDAVKRLDDEEVTRFNLGGLSGEINIVNESGLYSLILGSRKPEAKEFKRWVTGEVLPSIRKHGVYATDDVLQKTIDDPDFMIGLLNKLKEEKEERKRLEEQAIVNSPKVALAEAIGNSETLILVRELAKILKQSGHDTGEKRLYKWLRDNGYLVKSRGTDYNTPTQKSTDMDLFKLVESVTVTDKGMRTNKTSKVTGKGQQYFVTKFNKGV